VPAFWFARENSPICLGAIDNYLQSTYEVVNYLIGILNYYLNLYVRLINNTIIIICNIK
jgi:hypothetical protein